MGKILIEDCRQVFRHLDKSKSRQILGNASTQSAKSGDFVKSTPSSVMVEMLGIPLKSITL